MASDHFASLRLQLEEFVLEQRPLDVLAFGALVFGAALLLAVAAATVLSSYFGEPDTFMAPLPKEPCGEQRANSRVPICRNVTRSYDAGTLTYEFDVFLADQRLGRMSFDLNQDLSFAVFDSEGKNVGDVTIIDRTPIVRLLGIYHAQVSVTRTLYGRVFSAAVTTLGKSAGKAVSEDAAAQFGQQLAQSMFDQDMTLGKKTANAEDASVFLGWIQTMTYLAAAFAVVGYVAMGFLCAVAFGGKRHTKEDLRLAIGSRLSYFDFVVDNLPALGLLGTMIGMVSAFGGITDAESTDHLVSAAARSQLFGGIQFAVWTTIIALVLMLVIKLTVCLPINHFLLHRVTKVFGRVRLK